MAEGNGSGDVVDLAWSAAVENYEQTGDVESAARAAAVVAGQIGAAAACSAVGLAAAAPLCGLVGGEVAAWIADDVVPFITNLFGVEQPEPSLIPRAEWNATRDIMRSDAIISEAFAGTVSSLIGFAQEIGLQPFTAADALELLRAAGMPLVPSRGVYQDPYYGTPDIRDPYWVPDLVHEWHNRFGGVDNDQVREWVNAQLRTFGAVAQQNAARSAELQMIAEAAAQRAQAELRRRRPPRLREKGTAPWIAQRQLRQAATASIRKAESAATPVVLLGGAALFGAPLIWLWRKGYV